MLTGHAVKKKVVVVVVKCVSFYSMSLFFFFFFFFFTLSVALPTIDLPHHCFEIDSHILDRKVVLFTDVSIPTYAGGV